MRHLPRLEDAPLWIDERDAFALELEPAAEIIGTEDAAAQVGEPIHVIEHSLPKLDVPRHRVVRSQWAHSLVGAAG
jgi:hypothetical protein